MKLPTERFGSSYLREVILLSVFGIYLGANGKVGPWCYARPQSGSDGNDGVITFSVVDRWGRFVTLDREDFTVYEEQRPQTIVEFSSESALPRRLALLLDTSNSVRENFSAIQDAAAGFVRNSLRCGYDQPVLVSFDVAPEVVVSFGEGKQIADEVRNLRPGGATSLYDAIELAARRMSDASRGGSRYRFVMVVFSDGEDNESRRIRDQALEAAQRVDAVIFAVSTSMQRVATLGDRVLKYLTSETGGTALSPSSVVDFPHSLKSIAQELRHQHQIVFRPEPVLVDGFHVVQIRLKQPEGFTIRARKVYYSRGALRWLAASGNRR